VLADVRVWVRKVNTCRSDDRLGETRPSARAIPCDLPLPAWRRGVMRHDRATPFSAMQAVWDLTPSGTPPGCRSKRRDRARARRDDAVLCLVISSLDIASLGDLEPW